jgi:hypothetical protein
MFGTMNKIICFLLGLVFGVTGWVYADTGHQFLAGTCLLMTCFYAWRLTET